MRIFLLLLLLTACVSTAEMRESVSGIAAKSGLHSRVVKTSTFKIFTLARIQNPDLAIRYYIEGDGYSWRTQNMPSSDPTPPRSVIFEALLTDNYPNIVYIARPCQYALADAKCEEKFWTTGIYAPEAVTATNEVIQSFGGKAELVGYSGGAAIAVLVAAQNQDIISLRSIAGNLDSKEFVKIHNLSPLTDSADMDIAIPKLKNLPQIHFVGNDDEIITPQISKSYENKLGSPNCSKTQIVKATHTDGWKQIWQELVKITPKCD